MSKKTEKNYSYCKINKSKFIIMKKQIAPPNAWYTFANTTTEYTAKTLVDVLNTAEKGIDD